ncbi:TetR/AcrR family transcriptional regulator [Olivibacter sitiensis]|uniref:TetR/AcrR family transcriptional regulator n=1 Tax=Olivibacter sitiensis TaxID=376470 RepID=UPI000A02D1AF|nr:TetR/AcrR family transcriptional regulator [Olivibacter sitiensis]
MATDSRQQQIIESALRRFSHFGINKTTMGEIAEDNGVSKANLYYYFPDKTALVIAVIKHLIADSYNTYRERAADRANVLTCLNAWIDVRREYFEKYYLLHVTLGTADNSLNMEQLTNIATYAQSMESKMTSSILEQGVQNGELVTMDIGATSNIYVNILKGLAMVYISCEMNKDLPELGTFTTISNQQKLATEIFVNGLRKQKKQ